MRILLIEDEPAVASLIEKSVRDYGHEIDLAITAAEGLTKHAHQVYDMLILDIMLPDQNGWAVCKQIRAQDSLTPILMLTALGELDHMVHGFSLGADDYLPKPFRIRELIARIDALHRRSGIRLQEQIEEKLLRFEDIEMNLTQRVVKRGGEPIPLTSREFYLLKYFMQNPKRVLSRAAILDNVWSINFDLKTNVVDVYVNYLRNKIDKNFETKLIHTVIGMGYVLKKQET